MDEKLTHIDEAGNVVMVDVGDKADTKRRAVVRTRVLLNAHTFGLLTRNALPKGDVLTTAKVAGIMAAKRTADLIPLCHPLPLTKAVVVIAIDPALPGFTVKATIATQGQTGVEMEALTAVSVACLTLFDMLKAIDRTMVIGDIAVAEKTGGKSDWPD